MHSYLKLITTIQFIALIVAVAGLSILSTRIWGGKSEEPLEKRDITVESGMTLSQFAKANDIPKQSMKEIFGLTSPSGLQKPLAEYGSPVQIESLVTKKRALASEHETKNWIKIPIKFLLWFAFLGFVFALSRKTIRSKVRKQLLFVTVMVFGVIMGSDPSPMGTIKDAIHLYAVSRAIFPPRLIAMAVFLLIVFLANKYICAWGCQVGALQDIVFRINRSAKMKTVIWKQIKLPFVLTNSFRFLFLCAFTVIAFLWGKDIIAPIDPFKIYKPMSLELAGGLFIGVLLLASLFIYRPWCHLFCPFGFAGWLVEKVSWYKISVNYDTCIACGKCERECPSQVMGAILKRDKITIPDCYSCDTCREVCPTNSISFSSDKRTLPPKGHFQKGGTSQ